ncbi:hypothetical protein niasHS_001421 [Heterodera schachtii]|uniref:Uncharacterized protein n=1 Tax=Heterodera schachtii TaxID=97005 RepID=A0ABD2KDN2_HETSC
MCQFGMAQQSRTEESAFTLHLLQWHSLKRGMPETQYRSATRMPWSKETSQPHPNTACHDGKKRTTQKKAAAAEHEQFNRTQITNTQTIKSNRIHQNSKLSHRRDNHPHRGATMQYINESNDDTDSKHATQQMTQAKSEDSQLSNVRTSNNGPNRARAKDEPTAPCKDEPTAPSKDEPTAPSKDEPTEPCKDEPTAPSKDEPTAPSKDEPIASQPRPR